MTANSGAIRAEVAHFLLTDGAVHTQGTLGASDAAP